MHILYNIGFGVSSNHHGELVKTDSLRTAFATAMSQMYRDEVPLYGDLIRIVTEVNRKARHGRINSDSLQRMTLERHGAIRLGKPEELHTIRRVFAVLGMQPVGYYDLSVAKLPLHATCFRPVDNSSLATNPFRVFTTLLRPDLVRSEQARNLALHLLSQRNIFTDELMAILALAERQHGLYAHEADTFIREALKTFSWAPVASSTSDEYNMLKAQHPILADITCFKTAHINHLTPRTLNISLAHSAMGMEGIAVKDRIEGPPRRACPILLRQTSFLALEEPIKFKAQDQLVSGSHKARFGEIEERGAAVTLAGRQLYDRLLDETMELCSGQEPEAFDQMLKHVFQKYPDDWHQLLLQGLVYFEFQYTGKPLTTDAGTDTLLTMENVYQLVEQGYLEAKPITYEDFLPFSAAGIFQSNLGNKSDSRKPSFKPWADPEGFEAAMGCRITDPHSLYFLAQKLSIENSFLEMSKAAGVKQLPLGSN
ncbi:unnamed protein product [Clonostachys rhizophaga]|uniref:2-oxoadipate dioxygenase/decarboxylase n=1 Tax=Clonostachys rhizophaga TaxID=160324 RepID=A0A9N9VGC1_9HYPO|nr:unnamed protein product [Clonostachys rhizophaga]